ncbi:MAG: DUF1402 family protein [Patescibacteria group bacterium]
MWIRKIWIILVYLFALIGFVLVAGYFAVKWQWTNSKSIIDQQDTFFKTSSSTPTSQNTPQWAEGDEWKVFKEAVIRDKESINKAAKASNTSPRLLVAELAVEQLRLFHTEREIFKSVFAPLKLLGNQSQFSWGVMGIKQETAIHIEQNLKNTRSPYYLGPSYENLLDFTATSTDDINTERFSRIIDENSRYYSYLYAALYNKQVITQWEKANFDISTNPGIVSTLYNIGFSHSKPNASPKIGGAELDILGKTYSFGGLAQEFYYSSELHEHFPAL